MAVAIAVLSVLLQSELGRSKDQLRAAVQRGSASDAQVAIEALAALKTPAAVDALLEAAGICRREELDSYPKYKELLEKDRQAFENYQRHQEKLRAASAEYARNRTPENQKKYQEIARESKSVTDEHAQARSMFEEFANRYRSIGQIRQAAIASLKLLDGEAAARRLIERLKNAGEWMIRAGIAAALEGAPEAVPALLEQLRKEKEPTVKMAILDALSRQPKSADIVRAAAAELKNHESWQVQFAALQLIRALTALEAVEDLIDAMARAEGRLVFDFQETLKALTQVDKGILPASWKSWWDQNKEAVLAGTYVPRPEERARQATGRTSFFGIPVVSRRVVFILDRSGSMAQPADFELPIGSGDAKFPPELAQPGGNRKIDVARWQLKRVLHQLPDGTVFNLIFYSTDFQRYKPQMLTMTPAVRREAFAYIDSLEPIGVTNIFDSLESGLAFAPGDDGRLRRDAIDTIYLLSDGLPNRGRFTRPDEIRREIQRLNAPLKVAVHTILVGSSAADETFMKGLAEDNHGEFRSMKPARPRKMESR